MANFVQDRISNWVMSAYRLQTQTAYNIQSRDFSRSRPGDVCRSNIGTKVCDCLFIYHPTEAPGFCDDAAQINDCIYWSFTTCHRFTHFCDFKLTHCVVENCSPQKTYKLTRISSLEKCTHSLILKSAADDIYLNCSFNKTTDQAFNSSTAVSGMFPVWAWLEELQHNHCWLTPKVMILPIKNEPEQHLIWQFGMLGIINKQIKCCCTETNCKITSSNFVN